jgi:hypothetical protein
MPGIIEIWRRSGGLNIPIRFTVGSAPAYLENESEPQAEVVDQDEPTAQEDSSDNPPVSAIKHYQTGAFKGDAYIGPCYVVRFKDCDVRRIIPASEVVDIAYNNDSPKPKTDGAVVPDLEE